MEEYKTISEQGYSEFKEKGSQFLGFAYGLLSEEEADRHIQALRALHPKATHHCSAYSWGIDEARELARDDGEPSGTAGIPILGQIKSMELHNVLVVSVRYYGGTKLGTGGLKKAYKKSAKTALEAAQQVHRKILVSLDLQTDYAQNQKLLDLVERYEGRISSQQIDMISLWTVEIPRSRQEKFKQEVFKFAK